MVGSTTYVPSLAYGAACRTEQQMSRQTWTLANLNVSGSIGLTPAYSVDDGPPHASQTITTDSLIIWRPTGDGAGNIHVITSKPGAPEAHGLGVSTTAAGYTSRTANTSENNSALDPDVRNVYDDMCVRDLDAKCVVSINMGGGYATLRAKPMLHAHYGMTIDALLADLKTDIHDTKSYRVGYDNKKGARIVFHPWLQSKKALGEWTSALSVPRPYSDGTTTLQHNATFGYTDSFPFGGWLMCFSELAPMMNLGVTPTMTIISRLDIQVQLDSSVNHLRMRQHNLTAKQLHDHHDKDKQPSASTSQGDAMEQAFESAMNKSKQKSSRGGNNGFLAKNKKPKPQPVTPGYNQQQTRQSETVSWKPSLRPMASKAAAVIKSATSNKQLRDGLLNVAYHASQQARSRGQQAIRDGELRRRRR